MVATSDPLAAEAGLEILRQGGNAIDAAVATGAVLDVTSQNDTGIGGDLFALVYVAKDKKLYALNSGGWAPAGWTPEFFTDKLGVKTRAEQRRELGDGARRDLRLRRAAEALRHDRLQGDVRARGAARRRRLGPAERRHSRSAAARPTACATIPIRRQTFLVGGAGAGALQHHPQSRPREGAAADPGAGPRRVLPGRRSPTRSSRRCRPTAA